MKVYITTDDSAKLTSGCMSFISFENAEFIAAVNRMFGVRSHERVEALEITPDGMKALIPIKTQGER